MAFDTRSLDDYVDVPERIAEFRANYPEGSLQPADPTTPYRIETLTVTLQGETGPFEATKTFLVYVAAAYRHPDDMRPGIGMAWEPLPGQTPYTRNSELMNAETSAWGRAIVAALAADSKRGVSTRGEVRARQAERDHHATATTDPSPAPDTPQSAEPVPVPIPGQASAGEASTGESPLLNTSSALARRMFAVLNAAGIKDKADRLAEVSAIIGREIASSSEMTDFEARQVVATLEVKDGKP